MDIKQPDSASRAGLTTTARRWKRARYLGSGLLILLIGIVILLIGLSIVKQAYSKESLVVGLGVLLIIVGLLRSFIGLITPTLPGDLPPKEAVLPQRRLTDVLFGRGNNTSSEE